MTTKFSQFLLERHLAGVYVNADETLSVINNSVKKDFALGYHGFSVDGACLLSQIVYTIEQVTDIPAKNITDSFSTQWLKSFSYNGRSLGDIVKHIEDSIINHKNKHLQVKLGAEIYHNIDAVIADVKTGQPVICIVGVGNTSSLFSYSLNKLKSNSPDGIIPDHIVNDDITVAGKGSTSHSYLVIGYDAAKQHVILRDMKYSYSFKGYMKVSRDAFDRNFNKYKFIAVTVEHLVDAPASAANSPAQKFRKAQNLLARGQYDEIIQLGLSDRALIELITEPLGDSLWRAMEAPSEALQISVVKKLGMDRFLENEHVSKFITPKVIAVITRKVDRLYYWKLLFERLGYQLSDEIISLGIEQFPGSIFSLNSPSVEHQLQAVKRQPGVYTKIDERILNWKWDQKVTDYMNGLKLSPLSINADVKNPFLDLEGTMITSLDGLRDQYDQLDLSANRLTSLKGSPKTVFKFWCNRNLITDLIGGPSDVAYYYATYCHELTSLEGAPKSVIGFNVNGCTNLRSLEGCPETDRLNINGCIKITSLAGCPRKLRMLNMSETGITSLKGIHKQIACDNLTVSDVKEYLLDMLFIDELKEFSYIGPTSPFEDKVIREIEDLSFPITRSRAIAVAKRLMKLAKTDEEKLFVSTSEPLERTNATLAEGLIKIPRKTTSEIVQQVRSAIVGQLSTIDDVTLRDIIKDVFNGAAISTIKDVFTVPVDLADLPSSYRRLETNPFKVKISLEWNPGKRARLTQRAADALYSDRAVPMIRLRMSSFSAGDILRLWSNVSRNRTPVADMKDELLARLDMLEATIEHELMHMVQFKVLKPLDDRQAHRADSVTAEKHGKEAAYYSSNVEFHPSIRSALAMYIADERLNLVTEIPGTREEWVKIFTGAKTVAGGTSLIRTAKNGGFITPSVFFKTLKQVNQDKWKLAVKLFVQELERKYPK